MSTFKTSLIATCFVVSSFGIAHAGVGEKGHGHNPSHIGMPGKAAHVDRTIEVEMTDNAFSVNAIDVKAGETIRFKLVNKGDFAHEFSIGTAEMHHKHQKEMMKMMDAGMLDDTGMPMGMDHDDENTLALAPGKSGELIWKFTKSGRLEAACNLPGHYESGMFAKLAVLNK